MVLVRKHSRLITVDGLAFRWRVRRRPAHAQAAAVSPLSFAVERADHRGSVLIATMPGSHPANWLGATTTPVVPALVAAVIRQARAEGWQPERPGPAYSFTAGEEIWNHAE